MSKRKKKISQNQKTSLGILAAFLVVVVIVLVVATRGKGSGARTSASAGDGTTHFTIIDDLNTPVEAVTISSEVLAKYKPDIDEQLLTINEYSRPGTATDPITGIVVHYVGNAGTTAQANRNYFEMLKESEDEEYASSNFVVGLEGEIIECVPVGEIAYASTSRNHDTISIEVCHPDVTGEFAEVTYDSLVWLVGWLCLDQNLPVSSVIRHYDVNGKLCPLYYVEHEDAWDQFKVDVQNWVDTHKE